MSILLGLSVIGAMGLGTAVLFWARSRLVVVTVDGTSMMPALCDGDRVLVRRRSIGHLRNGDVVVLEPPHEGPLQAVAGPDGRLWNIKRVAALPGDRLPSGIQGPRTIPPGALVVLGDNPDSVDSRHRGLFSGDRLLGVVVRRLGVAAGAE